MAVPVNADRVAEALLRYFRDPVQHRAEMLHANEITAHLELVVRLALGKPVEFADPALGIPGVVRDLRRAALFFVGQALFREGASHYQILGLMSDASADAVRENHRLLIQLVHPDRHNNGVVWPASVAARVNRAYSVLKTADTRSAYDQAEADARSKAEGMARKAAAFSASAGGIVRNRRQVRPPMLPEWLTAGVGGFVRQHPALAIFSGLILLSVLTIGGIVWSEREETLTRDVPQMAGGDAAGPGARFNGMQPNYGPRALLPVPDPSAVPVGNQPVRTYGNSAVPAAPDRIMATIPAPAPVTNLGSRRAPELAIVAPGRPHSGIDLRASESATTRMASAPAATTTLLSVESVPNQPSRSPSPDAAAPVSGLAANAPVVSSPAPGTPPAVTETPASLPVALSTVAQPPPTAAIQTVAAASVGATRSFPAPFRTEPVAAASPEAPTSAEVETLIAAFISYYEGGRLDSFAGLFDIDARTNEFSGRAAIRSDYDELFRRSSWRRISLRQLRWRAVGERTEAQGEIAVKIGWRDGREVEQRIAVDMELMRRGGRTVIARLSQQVRN